MNLYFPVMKETDAQKQSWLINCYGPYSIHVEYVSGNLAKSLLRFKQSISTDVWILKWGNWSVYLLAFDSPRRISCPPHVTLELFECCRLPVCCHLPQHIIHYFPNGLLLVCVDRLVHGVDGAWTILFHVLFNLPWQSGLFITGASRQTLCRSTTRCMSFSLGFLLN